MRMTEKRTFTLESDVDAGRVADGQIRYVVMRADVLMHVGEYLPTDTQEAFLDALESSVLTHARSSFDLYRTRGAATPEELLDAAVSGAARLGWGRWHFTKPDARELRLTVRNSPFAEGCGSSAIPVCSPIRGVVRAMLAAGGFPSARVTEIGCAAQGCAECTFDVIVQP
jgi:hypothetical protein